MSRIVHRSQIGLQMEPGSFRKLELERIDQAYDRVMQLVCGYPQIPNGESHSPHRIVGLELKTDREIKVVYFGLGGSPNLLIGQMELDSTDERVPPVRRLGPGVTTIRRLAGRPVLIHPNSAQLAYACPEGPLPEVEAILLLDCLRSPCHHPQEQRLAS